MKKKEFVCPCCNEVVDDDYEFYVDGKKVCSECYYARKYFAINQMYVSYGKDFNVENVGKLKVYINHESIKYYNEVSITGGNGKTFYLSVFGRTTYKRKKKSNGLSGNPCEFSFSYDLSKFYTSYEISKETFVSIFTKNLSRIKVPERKALMMNEKFIDYVYDCLTKTMNKYNDSMINKLGL